MAFNQTRQNATNNVAIVQRSIHALEQIALRIRDGRDLHSEELDLPPAARQLRLDIVKRHLQMVVDAVRGKCPLRGCPGGIIAEHLANALRRLGRQTQVLFKSKTFANSVSARVT